MKYLIKFNEELDSQTYKRAAFKLKKLGHIDRYQDMKDWTIKVEDKENLEKWKKNVEEFSNFGKFRLEITNPETKTSFTGDFYFDMVLDRDVFGDSLSETISNKQGYIWFAIGIIPVDQETLDQCLKNFPDNDMGNGFFWGLSLALYFTLENEKIEFTKLELHNYDEYISGDIKIVDRGSAGRLRNLLIKMFSDKQLGYPSGYTDIVDFYEMFNEFFVNQGLGKYGLTPELVSDFIRTKVSANQLFKQ